jgi:general stress protein 26
VLGQGKIRQGSAKKSAAWDFRTGYPMEMKESANLPRPAAVLFPVLDPHLVDWKEGDDIFAVVRHLVNGTHPGVLTTVDDCGQPHARWMASLSFDEIPLIYTLTSAESRKVRHIESNPQVNWMFSNANLSLILNLEGSAMILRDTKTIKRVWDQIQNKEQAYFLKNSMEGRGIAVMATRIKHIECCNPKNSLRFAVEIDRVRRVESQMLKR